MLLIDWYIQIHAPLAKTSWIFTWMLAIERVMHVCKQYQLVEL
jgi:hypothetical protein